MGGTRERGDCLVEVWLRRVMIGAVGKQRDSGGGAR